MNKDYETIKRELEERILAKQKTVVKDKAIIAERKERIETITELKDREAKLNKELGIKPKKPILNKIRDYVFKYPVQTVFHVGAVMMLFQQEWLPLAFCIIFPAFVPMIQKNTVKKNDKR